MIKIFTVIAIFVSSCATVKPDNHVKVYYDQELGCTVGYTGDYNKLIRVYFNVDSNRNFIFSDRK